MCFIKIGPSCEFARQGPVCRGRSKVDTDRERKCITRDGLTTQLNYTEQKKDEGWEKKKKMRKDERGGERERSGRSIRQQRNVISMNLNKSALSLSDCVDVERR